VPKLDLNGLIASLLSIIFTPKGMVAFVIGLGIGFLIAFAPFVIIGLFIVLGIVLFVFRDRIDFKKIKTQLRGNPPSPPTTKPTDNTDRVEHL
jgi:hypothetical protein